MSCHFHCFQIEIAGGDGINQFLLKSEHFDVQFVYVAVQNKKVTNFLLVGCHGST
jgi:hypothetical protein